jgi:hypothetical protein
MHKSYDGGRMMFTSFEKNECESDCITFGDNSQVQVLGFGKIAITTEHSISKVFLVESLDHNLLSVSQFCEMDYNYLFTDKGVTVFRRSDDSFVFKDVLRGKLYLVDFIPEEVDLDLIDDEKASCDALQRMTIVDVRPQDPNNQSRKTSPNYTTPPVQGFHQDNHEEDIEPNDQGQEESNDQGGDEDDGDKAEAPPYPRVRQNIQRDHHIDNILYDIKKGVEDALRDPNWVVAM